MSTLYITDDIFVEHDTGPMHPESPKRIEAVHKALNKERYQDLIRVKAKSAKPDAVALAHPESHIRKVLNAIPDTGLVGLDPDTVVSPDSGVAAMKAAGALTQAVDAVMAGEATNAFCAVRPPGHHAEAERTMGFCLFNNVVVGARYARAEHGLSKVAVVDIDVHHGNGTQEAAWEDDGFFFASSHQFPYYPGTGSQDERGLHNNVVNVPLPVRTEGGAFRDAYEKTVLPRLRSFKPDLLFISAGFDAHEDDPLADLRLTEKDFAWVTRQLMDVADEVCKGRLVSVLEGGYNLTALGDSVEAHVGELMAA